MNKIINYFKNNPQYIILYIIVGYFLIQGIHKSFIDIREKMVISYLKEKGITLEEKEETIVKDLNKVDSVIREVEKEVIKKDYQKTKKINAKKPNKIVAIDTNDVKEFNRIMSKYK